jgi:hypothetical protein
MPKKTTILIIILAIITGVLIYLAVRSDQTLQTRTTTVPPTPTPVTVKAFADLSFSTNPVDVSKSSTAQVIDITINTNGKSVSGAQVELSYDPKVLTNVTLTPALRNPFFGANPVVLINNVDPTQGRISFAIAVGNNESEKTGTGSIATLGFTVNKFSGATFSQVTFLPKSAVTTFKSQSSVLNISTPLQIIVSQPPVASPTIGGR